jgi:hypothetical protein
VLDGTSIRGPVARSFALGVFTGAVLIAAPLAALTLTPANSQKKESANGSVAAKLHSAASEPYYANEDFPTDLASIIADGVSTSVNTAVAAVGSNEPGLRLLSRDGDSVENANGTTTLRGRDGSQVTLYPVDSQGRRRMVARSADGATAVTYADARDRDRSIDAAIKNKALGVTPEYIGAMQAAAPKLRELDAGEFSGLRAVGVTPEYARDLVAAGFPSIDEDELVSARAIGLTGGYIRAMRAAGVNGTLDDFVQLRAVGVDPAFAARARRSGVKITNADDLVELRALSGGRPPAPPKPPSPPGRGGTPPPDWDPLDPDDG